MKRLARLAFRRRVSLFEMAGIAAGMALWVDAPVAGAICGYGLAWVINLIGWFYAEHAG